MSDQPHNNDVGEREPDGYAGADHHVLQYQCSPTQDQLHEDEWYLVMIWTPSMILDKEEIICSSSYGKLDFLL